MPDFADHTWAPNTLCFEKAPFSDTSTVQEMKAVEAKRDVYVVGRRLKSATFGLSAKRGDKIHVYLPCQMPARQILVPPEEDSTVRSRTSILPPALTSNSRTMAYRAKEKQPDRELRKAATPNDKEAAFHHAEDEADPIKLEQRCKQSKSLTCGTNKDKGYGHFCGLA